MGGGAREVTSWRNGKCRDSEPHECAVVGEEDGEGGEGNPLGELGENDSHPRQAGYSWVHRCALRCAKL